MVLHLADKTSANTTSPANSMLATSENVACSGCAWKWRPRSVLQCIAVHMAASSWPTQSYTEERARPARLFPSTPSRADSFRGKSSHTQYFLLGRLVLDVETSLEVRAFINGDALGRDVAHDNGRLP